MPIYEYNCEKCGTFETTQRITEKPLNGCPTCKGKVKKLISTTSFQLKGTGWYITDYARKDKPSGKSDSGATATAKTESKPAAESKSETKEKPAEKKETKSKPSGSESNAA